MVQSISSNSVAGPQPDPRDGLAASAMEVMRRCVPRGSRCALLDYPDHPNVGDSAIWLGERRALHELGTKIVYQCDYRSYSRNNLHFALRDNGIILMHGGGNFGTIWPWYQDFREQVLIDFPKHRIVQLPQTVLFDDPVRLERSRQVINGHRRFVILVRDRVSLDFVRTHFLVESCLVPDSAVFLSLERRRRRPMVDVLALARTDKESAYTLSVLSTYDWNGHSFEVCDWLSDDLPGRIISRFQHAINGFVCRQQTVRASLYSLKARCRLDRGLRLLERGRVVVTDRLHCHLLCTLLGKPHVVVGNNNGKIHAFFGQWTAELPYGVWAETPDEAHHLALKLLEHCKAEEAR